MYQVSIPLISGQLLHLEFCCFPAARDICFNPLDFGSVIASDDLKTGQQIERNKVSIPLISGQLLHLAFQRWVQEGNSRFNPLDFGSVIASGSEIYTALKEYRVSIPLISGQLLHRETKETENNAFYHVSIPLISGQLLHHPTVLKRGDTIKVFQSP